MKNHINVAAKDYVDSQFKSPETKQTTTRRPTFNKPPDKTLQCCKCGNQHDFPDDVEYEEIAACSDDDCLGQCFCNQWNGWEDSKIVSV